ncbi:histidine kinase [Spirochaetia bacterium]|nr:histidine kinase [Spirochaetia bacterium]
MPGVRKRGEDVRDFIVNNVTGNPKGIVTFTALHFGISRPAVHKHIQKLIQENILAYSKQQYSLKFELFTYTYRINKDLSEDVVWETDIKKHFLNVPENAKRILIYGFMEIFNNAIEHSQGKNIFVAIKQNKIFMEFLIIDDGIGIFANIQDKFNLVNKEDALLELTKGKRTTEKSRHSGQGIFFTSKMFDYFLIYSDRIHFIADDSESKIVLDIPKNINIKNGTVVSMRLLNSTTRTPKEIFDKFSTQDFEFDRTIVPVKMAKDDDLVSRSQARRILNGLELFTEVILDFNSIQYIGQAFADELFRVFPSMNPNTTIIEINANDDVQGMINRARNTRI